MRNREGRESWEDKLRPHGGQISLNLNAILKERLFFSLLLHLKAFGATLIFHSLSSVQFSSVQFSCSVVSNSCDSMNHSTPGLPVHHQLPESTQTHVHWVGDAIQSSHPLSSPSPPALDLYQHQGLFKWVSSSHQVAKELEFQRQHQFFQWTPRTNLL